VFANVLLIRSVSYSGVTWLELLLATHPLVVSIGPADRSWGWLRGTDSRPSQEYSSTCSEFWSSFRESGQFREGEFIEQIVERTGCSTLVLDNPSDEFSRLELEKPNLNVHEVHLIRDPIDVMKSYQRSNPKATVRSQLKRDGWLRNSIEVLAKTKLSGGRVVHYEDLLEDPLATLNSLGSALGLVFPPDSLRYWEFDHITFGGNTGPLSLVGYHLTGKKPKDSRYEAFYNLSYSGKGATIPTRRSLQSFKLKVLMLLLTGNLRHNLGYKFL
jgi:hypothetical protein